MNKVEMSSRLFMEVDELGHVKREGPTYTLMKKLSQYSVNLRRHDFDEMNKSGIIEEVIEGFYVIFGRNQYSNEVGLLTDNKWLEETYIV